MNTAQQRVDLLQKWFKESPEFTLEKLEAVSDVSKSTIQRILKGEGAQFESVCKVVIALGHTVDEYLGVVKENKELTMVSLMKSAMEQQLREKDIILELMLKEKDAVIEGLKNDIATGEKSKAFLKKSFFILAAATGTALIICFVFIFLHMLTHIK